jgi:four helix bundle protein
MSESFFDKLSQAADIHAHLVYQVTKKFPKDEIFGLTSQYRRAALSVPLNIIEGYARGRSAVYRTFLETAFASLKEAQYITKFSLEEGYINQKEKDTIYAQGEVVAKMLWTLITKLRTK